MQATQEELDRFMSYVDKLPNGCWFWTGGRSRGKGNKKWYGSFWFRGKSIRAHRFSCDYIGEFEPLPPGQHRDHTCVFSMCVNPEHLEQVPKEVNQERKVERQGLVLPEWQRELLAASWPAPALHEATSMLTVCYGDPAPSIFNRTHGN